MALRLHGDAVSSLADCAEDDFVVAADDNSGRAAAGATTAEAGIRFAASATQLDVRDHKLETLGSLTRCASLHTLPCHVPNSAITAACLLPRRFKSLLTLDASRNLIATVVAAELPASLTSLNLCSNALAGPPPGLAAALPALLDLRLDGNRITGPLAVPTLATLRSLSLANNPITAVTVSATQPWQHSVSRDTAAAS